MNLLPIKELIDFKDEPEYCLVLNRAIKNSLRTVSDYLFTPSIKEYFVSIFEKVAIGKGGGFWIQAEYGAGKTHFLAVLASLLTSNNDTKIWKQISDKDISVFEDRIKEKKLFPVVFSLRGEAGIDTEMALLKVIERYIQASLEDLNLREKVKIDTEDETISAFNEIENNKIKEIIEKYIFEFTGKNSKDLSKADLSNALFRFCKDNPIVNLRKNLNVKDRIKHIYSQIIKNGFKGMLFIIDEFAFWQERHPEGSKYFAEDQEVLEVLASILPKEFNLNILTFVASQKPMPAKLRGEERFRNILLLAGSNEKDYEIIAAKRVREIKKDKKNELEKYYSYYRKNFKFYEKIDFEYFYAIFPFYPKSFDILRKITQRDLPSERSAIKITYEILNNELINNNNLLIGLSDMMISPHLIDCLNTTFYKDYYKAYRSAIDFLSDNNLNFNEDIKNDAIKIIKTVFLISSAYLDNNIPISIQELTEYTLILDDIINNAHKCEMVVEKIKNIPQLEYSKEKGIRFMPESEKIFDPFAEIFLKIKNKMTDILKIQQKWEELLVKSTGYIGVLSLFNGSSFGITNRAIINFNNIEYPGEYIILRKWSLEYGSKLSKEKHFRVVILSSAEEINEEEIKDPRIVVVVPDNLNEEQIEATKDMLALNFMEDEYFESDGKSDKLAIIRDWINNNRKYYISKLISLQPERYKNGRIFSQKHVTFNEKSIFSNILIDKILADIVNSLLSKCYTEVPIDYDRLDRVISSKETTKLFEFFFKGKEEVKNLGAARNFSAALGLSLIDKPLTYFPHLFC